MAQEIGNSFSAAQFVCDESPQLAQIVDQMMQHTLQDTPDDADLNGLETGILIRTVCILFGATILPVDTSLEQYKELKQKIIKVIKAYRNDNSNSTS